ncbi:MAG: ABC transporter permease [Ruminococcus sp.]|nr:ABC transporter permease [Ruminococcus sp.]
MQVFKLFFMILRRRLIPVFMFTGIFILILFTITSNGSQSESFEPSELRLVIFDEDGTKASKLAKDYLAKGNELVDIKDDDDEILDALYYTSIHYAVTINKGFEEKLEKGETDDLFSVRYVHENYSNVLADSKMNEYVRTVSAYTASGMDIESASKQAAKTLKKQVKVSCQQETKSSDEIMAIFFQYLPYVLFSAIISALGPVLIALDRKKVRDRCRCSALKMSKETAGKIGAASVFVLILWIVFLIAGPGISKGSYSGNTVYAIANSFIYALISAGIAILVASLVDNENILNVVIQIFGLGSSFLCGVFVPQELLGKGVLTAAKGLPAYWYIRANNSIFALNDQTFDTGEVLMCFGIEIGFAALVFALAFVLAKKKKN